MNIDTFSDLEQRALKWTPAQWEGEIAHLSPDQVALAIPLASKQHDDKGWQAKIVAAVHGLFDKASLELIGKTASFEQISEIFTQAAKDATIFNKLPPILVGLPYPLFRRLVTESGKEQLSILKLEIFTEPVQYRLTMLTHELEADINAYGIAQERLQREIEKLQVEEMGHKEINFIFSKIDALKEKGELLLAHMNNTLALAWSASRTDLIKQLSSCKEACQKILHYEIGGSFSQNQASGLWKLFNDQLNRIFEENPLAQSIGGLKDEEPAMQALARFGAWYPEDFWALGLLPNIPHLEQIEKLKQTSDQENLFLTAQTNLEKMGLKTVGDLKDALIYSKKGLKEYLEEKATEP